VDVVGRDDDDQVYALALGPGELAIQHRLPGRVVAVGRQPQRLAGASGLLGRRGERACCELVAVIERHGVTVHATDERAFPAAHHAVAQAPCHEPALSSPNAASNAVADGAKSMVLQNAADSVAPWTRSMRASSHSTDSGP